MMWKLLVILFISIENTLLVDGLDPLMAGVCRSLYQVYYVQRFTARHEYADYYETWCNKFPPYCSGVKRTYKMIYKSKRQLRYVANHYCCRNYVLSDDEKSCIPVCRDNCNADKHQGYCVLPGTCECREGFRGDLCESGCKTDRWGPNCEYICECGTQGTCDPHTGFCICHAGYKGVNCSEPCDGSFGLQCAHECTCENGATCNNVHGRCTCALGFYGPNCRQTCTHLTTQEQGCEQTCPCHNNGKCDNITGECICPPGYKGEFCTDQCDKFHWGSNCTEMCYCAFGSCDVITGECNCQHGYAGRQCQLECANGYFGKDCLTQCGCLNGGECYFHNETQQVKCDCRNTGFYGENCEIRDCPPRYYVEKIEDNGEVMCSECNCTWISTFRCHPLNGSCACDPGFEGHNCSDKCVMPYYGKNCEQYCECPNGDCHHITGMCTNCYAGYTGDTCETPCQNNTWGLQCVNQCECENRGICHPSTGYCECAAGFYGVSCENHCKTDTYGPHCAYKCECDPVTSECNPYTGKCHCKPGYFGPKCEDMCSEGYYGLYCQQICPCNRNTSTCDPATGQCHCKGGWYGANCENKCKPAFWGPYCTEKCDCNGNGYCHPETGKCRCVKGFYGDKCQTEFKMSVFGKHVAEIKKTEESSKTITIPTIIILVVLACLIVYLTRKYCCDDQEPRYKLYEDEEDDEEEYMDLNEEKGLDNFAVTEIEDTVPLPVASPPLCHYDDRLQQPRNTLSELTPEPSLESTCKATVHTDDEIREHKDDHCTTLSDISEEDVQRNEIDDLYGSTTNLRAKR